MGARELKRTIHLKPRDKQEINFTLAEVETPSLLAFSTRELEEGIPSNLKVLLETRGPTRYNLGKRGEVLLNASGEYSLVVENLDDFERSIEVNIGLRRVEVLRDVRYIVEKQLGRRTFLVNIKGKRYVYKNLPYHGAEREETLRSLVLWSQLDHEGIPRLAEINLAEGFYVAEYAEGINLEDLKKKLDENKVYGEKYAKLILEIVRKALEILEYTYEQRVVHGDVKQSNIVYDEDGERVYIIDWETCRKAGERLDVRGLSFPPPEVVNERVCSEKSDIYSLGLVLSWLLEWSGDKFTLDMTAKGPRSITRRGSMILKELGEQARGDLLELVKGMTEHEVDKRFTPSQAKELVDRILEGLYRKS